MRIVYYILPTRIGESITVSENIPKEVESEVAVLISSEDVDKPLYYIEHSQDQTKVELSDELQPYVIHDMDDTIFAVLPFRNSNEASDWMKFYTRRIGQLDEYYSDADDTL